MFSSYYNLLKDTLPKTNNSQLIAMENETFEDWDFPLLCYFRWVQVAIPKIPKWLVKPISNNQVARTQCWKLLSRDGTWYFLESYFSGKPCKTTSESMETYLRCTVNYIIFDRSNSFPKFLWKSAGWCNIALLFWGIGVNSKNGESFQHLP